MSMTPQATNQPPKLVKATRRKITLPPGRRSLQPQKAYTRRELAAEFLRLTDEVQAPNYLAEVASGARLNHRIHAAVLTAIANLEAKAIKGSAKE